MWHKSALGKVISEEILYLTDAEVIFCHEHRNIQLPNEDWIIECISRNPSILNEYTILESLRKPGNKIMITENADIFNFKDTPVFPSNEDAITVFVVLLPIIWSSDSGIILAVGPSL